MVGAQVLLGVACGMFTYAALTSIQTATQHEHLAAVTGMYFACFNVRGALGNSISGAIWTHILPGQLQHKLARFDDPSIAEAVYGAPFTATEDYEWGSPVREEIVEAYRRTQKLLCVTGICIAVLVLLFALILRDPRLTDDQSLPDAEEQRAETSDDYSAVRGENIKS